MAGSTKQRMSLRRMIWAWLTVLSVVFAAVVLASIVARIAVGHAVSELEDHLIPVRNATSDLSRAYVNQETGQRGFLLTGDPAALEPYDFGTAAADRLVPELRQELGHAPRADELLKNFDAVVGAAATWRTKAAEPQIAARLAGANPLSNAAPTVLEGKAMFDRLRDQYRTLNTRIDVLMKEQLQHIRTVQEVANIVVIAASIVMLATILVAIIVVRRSLTRPVSRLVRDVRMVADGDYNQPISHSGPREIAEVSVAVEDMRNALLESQQELEHLAHFDTPTGLVNHTETMVRLESALGRQRPRGAQVGVLFCDVDRFKTINDTWGHAVGDVTLATLARRVTDCVGEGDTVGRMGGDEILVLLPGADSIDDVVRVAEKISRCAAEPIYHLGGAIEVTVSVGATLAAAGESATAVTSRADEAMYQAKRAGRNTIVAL